MLIHLRLCAFVFFGFQFLSLTPGTAHAESACKEKKTRVKVVQGTLPETEKKALEKRYEKACTHSNHTMSIEQEGNDVYVVCKCG